MVIYKQLTLSSLWQISRKEILDSILAKIQNEQEIQNMWVSIGHIFVSVNRGLKLITFDVKPTRLMKQDPSELGCLDLTQLPFPILDILTLKPHNLAIVVLENGHIYIWRYECGTHLWQSTREADLCTVTQSSVVSVCVGGGEVWWCEKRVASSGTSSYCVCKRSLTIGGSIQLGAAVALLHNCPPSTIYIVNQTLFIFPRIETMTLTCLRIHLQHKTIDLYCGKVKVTHKCPPSWTSLDFCSIVQSCLHQLYQASTHNTLIVSTFADVSCSTVIAITDTVSLLSYTEDSVLTTKLQDFSHTKDTKYHVYNNLLLSSVPQLIRFYSKSTGALLQEMPCGLSTHVATPVVAHPPLFPVVYDQTDVYFIQKSTEKVKSKQESVENCVNELLHPHQSPVHNTQHLVEAVCKSYITGEKTPNHSANQRKHFSNPALVLTVLDQLSKEKYTELRPLHHSALESYSKEGQHKVDTDFSSIVEPYINEYLTLEKVWNDVFNTSHHNLVSLPHRPSTLETEIQGLIHPIDNIPVSVRVAQLEDFASLYPDRVLMCLMKLLPVDSEELSGETLEEWANVLMSDKQHSHVRSRVDIPLFDVMCRLMFKVLPNQLVKFVRISQAIYDRLVGVPAFLRKPQRMYYYERALSCVPGPDVSWCAKDAASATAQLMLSLDEKNVIEVTTLLSQYHLWDLSLKLLDIHGDDSTEHMELFHIVITAMAQSKVLTHYTREMLRLKPRQLTITTLLALMNPDQSNQLTTSTSQSNQPTVSTDQSKQEITLPDVKATQQHHISLDQIRSILLDLAYQSHNS